jgi:hypothetical protein
MRDAINDVELALDALEIDSIVRLFETASDSVMVKVPLGALRQLGRCYPTLNRIIDDPAFERGGPDARADAQTAKDPQTAFNLGFRAAGGGCHLPPSAEALFQSWLRDGASQAGREPEEEIPAPASPAQAPMRADIAQMIDAGWKTGKSSSEVAEEILREFDASTLSSTEGK